MRAKLEMLPEIQSITHLPCRHIKEHIEKYGELKFEDLFLPGMAEVRMEIERFLLQRQYTQLAKILGLQWQQVKMWITWFEERWEEEDRGREISSLRRQRVMLLERLYNKADELLESSDSLLDKRDLIKILVMLLDKMGDFEGSKSPTKSVQAQLTSTVPYTQLESKLTEIIQIESDEDVRRKLIGIKRGLLEAGDTTIQNS